ncbi:MAG TPA: hypothetical protein VD763_10835 [Candidatus Saccharimonadales bacterium]|nr:hypothetical protein [Candidatus Saccharimonadales bacterium]
MAATRLQGRRGDGAALVLGWVACYTMGLPAAIRDRRREEVGADLREEALDAVRRGASQGLFGQRLRRWLAGIPADVAWRLVDAPDLVRHLGLTPDWVPLTRWSAALLAIVAIGASGALTLVAAPYLTGSGASASWTGWGPIGFMLGCLGVMASVIVAVPWPWRAIAIVIPSVVVGLAAAPALGGCWALSAFAVLVRAAQATSWPQRR